MANNFYRKRQMKTAVDYAIKRMWFYADSRLQGTQVQGSGYLHGRIHPADEVPAITLLKDTLRKKKHEWTWWCVVYTCTDDGVEGHHTTHSVISQATITEHDVILKQHIEDYLHDIQLPVMGYAWVSTPGDIDVVGMEDRLLEFFDHRELRCSDAHEVAKMRRHLEKELENAQL